jgi:hypothetical protein
VQVEDAGQHPRLAGIELAARHRLLDQHLDLLRRLSLVEVVRADPDQAQDPVGRRVEQADERAEDLGEEVERPRDEP